MAKPVDKKMLQEQLVRMKNEVRQIESAERRERRLAFFVPIIKAALITAVALILCNFVL